MTSFFSFIVAAFTRIDLLAIHPQLRLLFRASAGAFFSLHCLIYKVHTVLNGSLLFYHTHIRLSSAFFKTFQTSFESCLSNFFILPHPVELVKNFFQVSFSDLLALSSNLFSLLLFVALVKYFLSKVFAVHFNSSPPLNS